MKTLKDVHYFKSRAADGDPDALYRIGMMYWTGRWIEGEVVPQDKCKAFKLIKRAANSGNQAAVAFVERHANEITDFDLLVSQFDKSDEMDHGEALLLGDVGPQTESESTKSAAMVPRQHNVKKSDPSFSHLLENLFLFPFRLLWNIVVIAGTITLTVLWIGFIFGSVIGVVLLLIFMPEGFLLPIALFMFCVPLWPDEE